MRITKKFLEEHPEEAKKYGQLKKSKLTNLDIKKSPLIKGDLVIGDAILPIHHQKNFAKQF